MKAEKILHRCDANEDGAIGKREFQDYYEQVAEAMNKFHRAKAAKAKTKQEKVKRNASAAAPVIAPTTAEEAEDVETAIETGLMTARAEKKWDALDIDDSGFLDAQEVLPLAAWVWESFRPGQTITPEAKPRGTAKR